MKAVNTGNWTKKEEILATPIPTHTGRYGVIPHEIFLDCIQEQINNRGLTIIDERYLTNRNNQRLSGSYDISGFDDIDICPSIYFLNSYDKSQVASIRIGGTVLVCKNGMLSSTSYKRKHLGKNALAEFIQMIDKGLDNLYNEFQKLILSKEEMKNTLVNKDTIDQLVGNMFLQEELITSTQLNILKHELKFSKDFNDDTLWSFYNNVTESYKSNNPSKYNKQHNVFHGYILDNFNLTNKPNLFKQIVN